VPFATANVLLKMSRPTDVKWARPDLNRRPSGYQPDAPAKLSYGPRRLEVGPNLAVLRPIATADFDRIIAALAERIPTEGAAAGRE
jgi:hypothetical protein